MGVKIITPPVSEQITLAEARLQLSIGDDGDSPPSHPLDPLIAEKIAAAREYCEDYLGMALAPQTVELALDSFWAGCNDYSTRAIELPKPPVTAIEWVKYSVLNDDGVTIDELTLADSAYYLDNYQEPAWLLPAYGVSWPSTYGVANAVKIRCNCGYSLRGDSPEDNPLPHKYYQAMMLLMTDMVLNRSATASEDARKAAENLMCFGRVRMGV